MLLRAIAVCRSPRDFRLQQRDPPGKFVNRKMVERFGRQPGGQIPDGVRAIVNFHLHP